MRVPKPWCSLTLALAVTSSVSPLWAQDGGFQCRQGELVREVGISYDTPGQPVPCRVVYRKPSEGVADQVLWRAASEAGYCEFKAKEFRAQLEAWGWVCASAAPGSGSDEQLGDEPPAASDDKQGS